MSKLLIGQYLNDLARLKQVSGTHRESVVREAFKDLLKGYARSFDLVFVPEYEITTAAKERRYVDGALLHALRMPFGYWEAKDEKDDLDAEIETKFKRGYPKDNIIFEDSQQAADYVVLAVDGIADLHFGSSIDAYQQVPLFTFDELGKRSDNITDWALKQFRDHYNAVTPAKAGVQRLSDADEELTATSLDSRFRGNDGQKQKSTPITKDAIFHYVYAVLHDPVYREKYAQNLKREFPRIPLYGNEPSAFWQWADWGRKLMALHIAYETVEPWSLTRVDIADEKARAASQSPKAMLKADKDAGRIVLDSETTLTGVPPEAWTYRLGNRSALEWVLDQHKESKPKDPTIRERFNTYRFADHKERVIDLLLRVTRVSVETQAIVAAMREATR